MTKWTLESAETELTALIDEIAHLSLQRGYSAEHTRWLVRSLALLEDIFGRDSRYYLSFAALEWRESGPMLLYRPLHFREEIDEYHQKAYLQQLETAKGLLLAARDHLQRADSMDAVYEGKDTGPESSLILRVMNIAEHRLRKVIRQTPSGEREIQDALEDLLVGADIPYSRETESIEYSTKTYTPDFTVARIDLAVDVKLCARKGREKEIIAEINDDILAYSTKFGNLLFVVYDVGHIRDVDRFTSEFEKHDNVIVRVVKH